MSRLIKPQDVDQFERILRVPEASVSAAVLTGVRGLDERRELEPAMQEILFDPNETPHGPTEIVDVLTTRAIVRGERKLTGIILKGRGTPKVRSRDVAHQFIRARTIPGLQLLILCAVGDIEDDAQRDFVTTALDAGADYLILDRVDTARLLLAYEKICPIDGTRYSEEGVCSNGHGMDKGISLEVRVREDLVREIPRLQDVSTAGAKRYSAVILTDRHYDREAMRMVLTTALAEVRTANYHRNDFLKKRWSGTDAHVVWLFLGCSHEDMRSGNWRARALWVHEKLPDQWRPMPLKADEEHEGMSIIWNNNYDFMREWFASRTAPKGTYLETIHPVMDRVMAFAAHATQLLNSYLSRNIDDDYLTAQMQLRADEVNDIALRSTNFSFPPADLEDFDLACHEIIGTVHNMYLPFTELGLQTWGLESRIQILIQYAQLYIEQRKKLEFERAKIR